MEALRASTASSRYRPSSFRCKATLQRSPSPSSLLPFPIKAQQSLYCSCPFRQRILISASLSEKSSDVNDAGKRTVASEKAVEGVNQQLHEMARKVSHNGGADQVKRVEAAADVASEEASDEASAEPSSLKSGNVGSGQEEGLGAAKKMTPKADN
ncbi:hypothetical protein GOP47_0025150 [Adiantum capillus-veneris]|uniref:Uncharacterized protein n=1 Tax=Adiantum capillus-veneris TaxID=13818 RepID=A0A9D4Z4B4_ADICA|nr:hypothetical protein GOP47_0025150 [Adiantum capillus-veneris]